jgi:acyl-coenzyme A thioesterase PaaI-like protein
VTAHHDGCFGCGQANLFGLQLEGGRFFVKQDHQGPQGQAHGGILAAALQEAMELAAGSSVARLEVRLLRPAPVGTFVDVEVGRDGTRATARVEDEVVAEAVADFAVG